MRYRADAPAASGYVGGMSEPLAAPSAPAFANRLIERLPPRQRASLLASCEAVELALGQVIAEPGGRMGYIYFPTGSAICLLAPMENGHVVEVLLVGNEGFYGVPVALGAVRSGLHAVVHGAGSAWRMEARAFRRHLDAAPFAALAASVDLYIHVLMAQLERASGCNRFHSVEKRVARWLLMTRDRTEGRTYPMTHERLAYTLGVRRVGITQAAGALQKRRLISYARGRVTVLDPAGLEAAACTCYRADLVLYEDALGALTRPRDRTRARRKSTPPPERNAAA